MPNAERGYRVAMVRFSLLRNADTANFEVAPAVAESHSPSTPRAQRTSVAVAPAGPVTLTVARVLAIASPENTL